MPVRKRRDISIEYRSPDDVKNCAVCGKDFPRPECYSASQWKKRKYCTTSCGKTKFSERQKLLWQSDSYREKTLVTKSRPIPHWVGRPGPMSMMGKRHTESANEKNRIAHLGKVATVESRLKASASHKKIRTQHHSWRGGVTPENATVRRSVELKLWREGVFRRDDYTCQTCGARSGNGKKVVLHADHIKPFAYFPELRTELSNGRTLCVACHELTDTYKARAVKNYAKRA